LIIACRNTEKGQKAVNYINETTNVAPGVVETWELDLANFENVKAFAKRGSPTLVQLMIVNKELDRLDILIENAGLATEAFRITQDEWEETYSILHSN
jgi:NAD(P)-dependent dehydrogenase (short-subunit alcohol dehydrogenase family)